MQWEIQCRPSYSLLEVALEAGESIVAESGAMAWMDPGFDVETMAADIGRAPDFPYIFSDLAEGLYKVMTIVALVVSALP